MASGMWDDAKTTRLQNWKSKTARLQDCKNAQERKEIKNSTHSTFPPCHQFRSYEADKAYEADEV